MSAAAKAGGKRRVVAENRRARYDYFIDETLEAGLMLTGTEVKSLREGKANIAEAYASPERGELYLINAHIPEYTQGNRFNHEPRRHRKLLVHARELARLATLVQQKGATIVPLELYFNERGIAKLDLGIARGKKLHDKRDTSKERDWQREKGRILRDKA
ncbi:MAG: SsrA-binding protein SmpB [Alphaproteobacteria bacterium]|nr:SsrA-binding protein SmpB [Alphaproteobacteria bacterium]